MTTMSEFTHFNEDGASRMVDVGSKEVTERMARAVAILEMQPETLQQIRDRKLSKGDVLEVARLAGIMSAKRTADLIPLCHPLQINHCEVDFELPKNGDRIVITASAKVTAQTGVEMEALTAVSMAALTLYDMCKSLDRAMVIERVQLEEKTGGKSGAFVRKEK